MDRTKEKAEELAAWLNDFYHGKIQLNNIRYHSEGNKIIVERLEKKVWQLEAIY